MPVSTPLAVHRYVTCFPREKGSLRNYQYNDNKLACYGQQGTDQPFLVQQGRKVHLLFGLLEWSSLGPSYTFI